RLIAYSVAADCSLVIDLFDGYPTCLPKGGLIHRIGISIVSRLTTTNRWINPRCSLLEKRRALIEIFHPRPLEVFDKMRSMSRTLMVVLILLFSLTQSTKPARAPRPGVKDPGVRVAISALKPDAVFEAPGAPDWIAIDESVWVSNGPKNSVVRIDPKSNK